MSSFEMSQTTDPSTFNGRMLWKVALWITTWKQVVSLAYSVLAVREVWISSRHGPLDGGLLRLNRPGPLDELGCRGKDRSFAMFTFWICEKPGDLRVCVSTVRGPCCSIKTLFQKPYHLNCPYFYDFGMGYLCQSVSPQSEDLWSVLQGNHAAMRTRISKVYRIPRLDSKVSLQRRKCYFLYHLWVIMSHVGHTKKDLFLWFLRNLLIS